LRTCKLSYKNIVIGGSLEALSYAYSKGLPVIGIKQKPHFFLDKHRSEWENLSFFLSLAGQLPIAKGLTSIRIIEDEKIIKCFTENSRMIEIEYETIHLVDDLGVGGIPLPTKQAKKEYLVFDWLKVVRGRNHPYDYLIDEDSDDFVKKVVFYSGIGYHKQYKNACAVSVLTEKKLKSLDYSETYTVLKVREMMKDAGLKGNKNGTQAYNGKPAYQSLKIEFSQRDKVPLHRNEYANTKTIKFIKDIDLKKDEKLPYNDLLEVVFGSPYGRGKARTSKDVEAEKKV
tara:strand:+ start:5543 stop:6400 length:858 start_codon:yes stop_codon:yes gene_type:complete